MRFGPGDPHRPRAADSDLVAAEERGGVIIAGCVIDEDSPAFHCNACGRNLPDKLFAS